MIQEEKELLLKDLCARLLYGVLCEDMEGKTRPLFGITPTQHFIVTLDNATDGTNGLKFCTIDCVKPYLRPMSSMTEDDIIELSKIDEKRIIFSSRHLTYHLDGEVIDYLNRKMFDYRGLIPMGLAIEASEGMYE